MDAKLGFFIVAAVIGGGLCLLALLTLRFLARADEAIGGRTYFDTAAAEPAPAVPVPQRDAA